MIIAPKRMHIIIWNFVTFPKYQKQKFWKKFEFKFLTLPPLGIVFVYPFPKKFGYGMLICRIVEL